VHYNSPTQYYPPAELSAEDNAEVQQQFDCTNPSIYDAMKAVREKYTANSKKA